MIVVGPNLSYYPGIYPKGLRTIMKILSENSLSPGPDLNPGPSE
jgi:hypothetical protein